MDHTRTSPENGENVPPVRNTSSPSPPAPDTGIRGHRSFTSVGAAGPSTVRKRAIKETVQDAHFRELLKCALWGKKVSFEPHAFSK